MCIFLLFDIFCLHVSTLQIRRPFILAAKVLEIQLQFHQKCWFVYTLVDGLWGALKSAARLRLAFDADGEIVTLVFFPFDFTIGFYLSHLIPLSTRENDCGDIDCFRSRRCTLTWYIFAVSSRFVFERNLL